MKKKIIAAFTAFLCGTSLMTSLAAHSFADKENLTITADTFTYTGRPGLPNGFKLETEIPELNQTVLMVVGYGKDRYAVTPVNCEYGLASGVLETVYVERDMDGRELTVGDFITTENGPVMALEVMPEIYITNPEMLEGHKFVYLGNGMDLLGEEFEKVIRLQMVIEQEYYDTVRENGLYKAFNLEYVKGDASMDDELSIVDCLVINKNLLAGSPLCDYAKFAGDVNGNNILDFEDSYSILKEVVDLTEDFQ